MREVREGKYGEAGITDFVKPSKTLKLFTGGIRGHIEYERPDEIDPETPVWISKCVPFGSEFRFYMHSVIGGAKIQGWSRYDDDVETYSEPDVSLVEDIAKALEDELLNPSAYSIDIGWRKDLNRYCLVEINDGWSLGFYENRDPQSNPPSRKEYAEMLISRWTQILFCNLF